MIVRRSKLWWLLVGVLVGIWIGWGASWIGRLLP